MSNEFKGVSLGQAIRAATAARPLRPAPEARPTSPVNGGRIAVPRMLSIPPPFMGEVSSGEAARRRGCEVTENSRIPATFENGQNRPFGATGQGIGRLEVFCFFRKETEWTFSAEWNGKCGPSLSFRKSRSDYPESSPPPAPLAPTSPFAAGTGSCL